MKEIKFRAWDKKGKKWMSHEESGLLILNFLTDGSGQFILDEYDPIQEMAYNIGTHIQVSMFTGLKDKNGVEIYEGDIIQSVSEMVNLMSGGKTGAIRVENYEVRWEPNKARWGRWRNNKFELLYGLKNEFLLKWYTVIGNIYENPELIDRENGIKNDT